MNTGVHDSSIEAVGWPVDGSRSIIVLCPNGHIHWHGSGYAVGEEIGAHCPTPSGHYRLGTLGAPVSRRQAECMRRNTLRRDRREARR